MCAKAGLMMLKWMLSDSRLGVHKLILATIGAPPIDMAVLRAQSVATVNSLMRRDAAQPMGNDAISVVFVTTSQGPVPPHSSSSSRNVQEKLLTREDESEL